MTATRATISALTLSRRGDGYVLAGQLGNLLITTTEPMSAAAAERYVVLFGRRGVVIDLPADDQLADLGRGAR